MYFDVESRELPVDRQLHHRAAAVIDRRRWTPHRPPAYCLLRVWMGWDLQNAPHGQLHISTSYDELSCAVIRN